MAVNFSPDPNRPLCDQVNNETLRRTAEQAAGLLKRFPKLAVGNISCREKDNAWSVGFRYHDINNPIYLMNFKITPSAFDVEFRRPDYLPDAIFSKLPWQSNSWQRARSNRYSTDQLFQFIRSYLVNLQDDYTNGKIKMGGKSVAEVLLARTLRKIYPNTVIICGEFRDDIRSEKTRPLQLDIFLPELKLAIEVQGEQHFTEIYGCNKQLKANDIIKRRRCAENGIKLIWMNWTQMMKQLYIAKLSDEKRIVHLTKLLNSFLKGPSQFLWWKSMDEQVVE